MEIEEEEQNYPFCQKLYINKDMLEHHLLIH